MKAGRQRGLPISAGMICGIRLPVGWSWTRRRSKLSRNSWGTSGLKQPSDMPTWEKSARMPGCARFRNGQRQGRKRSQVRLMNALILLTSARDMESSSAISMTQTPRVCKAASLLPSSAISSVNHSPAMVFSAVDFLRPCGPSKMRQQSAVAPGQASDAVEGRQLLGGIGPLTAPLHLIMDRAYEDNKTLQLALDFGYIPVIPPRSNRLQPWQYDKAMYRKRNEMERLFRRLKGFRRIFSRFDKLDVVFLAFLNFALIVEALR